MKSLFILRNPAYCQAFARRLAAMHIPWIPRLIDYFVRFFLPLVPPHGAGREELRARIRRLGLRFSFQLCDWRQCACRDERDHWGKCP